MSDRLDTSPEGSRSADSGLVEPALPPLGTVGLLRWMWRQLTSMRVALILLFLLALASVPGSLLPQRGNNPIRVTDWITNNPGLGPFLDAVGFFDVYASPWFAAVYMLLFVSLVGCVVPRAAQHWRAMLSSPPVAPRRLERLPEHLELRTEQSVGDVLDAAARGLRSRRWRVRIGEDWIAAEKGFLRETGNLVFHVALLVVVVGIAFGGLFGWKGNVIVREGTGFSDTLTQYDAWGGGRLSSADDLAPFSFALDSFDVEFERGEAQRGAPREFSAELTYRESPTSPAVDREIAVNEPMSVEGATVYLVGHGYAPHIVVTDSTGRTVFDDSVVFLPQDGAFTSTGVVKVPDATPQLGLSGLFLPTAALSEELGPHSTFPAPDYPALFLAAFTGDLGMDSGVPQSVYMIDTSAMQQIGLESLLPGATWTLPDGAGTVTFKGWERWANFQISNDPGKLIVLAAAIVAVLGLLASLFIRRRRMWVRAIPEAGATLCQVGGLAKSDDAVLAEDLAEVAADLTAASDGG